MAKDIDAFGYFDLTPQEQSSETSAITAAMAGIVSGAIKVPEGVVSLGAELIDLGFDTDLAAKVEVAFDRFNIFVSDLKVSEISSQNFLGSFLFFSASF